MVKIYKIALIFLFVAWLPTFVAAASLSFSPASGNAAVGKTLSVSVYVSSADQAMNAASGVVSFPADLLEVTSLSKTGSVLNLWAEEPSFSNSEGTVNFGGVVLNPGFTGASGKLLTINFRVKASGQAALSLSSGSVLANDGNGTEILTGSGKAQFSLSGAASVPIVPAASVATPAPVVAGLSSAPQISSPTHPDPNKWYAQKDAKFTWPVPDDVTAVRLLVAKSATAVPSIVYEPAVSEKTTENLPDGILYFHAQFKNGSGWGKTAHFRFQTDTEKPTSFEIAEVPRHDQTEPKAKFTFNAKDRTSGIGHYEIQIDQGQTETWNDDGSHIYETSVLDPGQHTLTAKAVDKAGNSLDSSAEFTIQGINPPTITDYPKELQSGETLVVRGSSYPNGKVVIWLQKEKDDPQSFTVKSDQSGQFTLTSDEKLEDGTYQLWAEAVGANGAKSLPTDKLTLRVARPAIYGLGVWILGLLAITGPILAVIALVLLISWYLWHEFRLLMKRRRKIIQQDRDVPDLLKKDIKKLIKVIEKTGKKRLLTAEEGKIHKQLKKFLPESYK